MKELPNKIIMKELPNKIIMKELPNKIQIIYKNKRNKKK
jgi:hypothetical protein